MPLSSEPAEIKWKIGRYCPGFSGRHTHQGRGLIRGPAKGINLLLNWPQGGDKQEKRENRAP